MKAEMVNSMSEYTMASGEGVVSDNRTGQDDLALFNPQQPLHTLQKERPEHRIVIYLKAQGYSHKEIGEITGYSPQAVMYICRQPWAQERIVKVIHDGGQDAVNTLLKGAAVDAVQRLITEQDNDNASPRERISAANSILDRVFGRPNQPMTHYRAEDLEKMSDEQLMRLLPNGTTTTTT